MSAESEDPSYKGCGLIVMGCPTGSSAVSLCVANSVLEHLVGVSANSLSTSDSNV